MKIVMLCDFYNASLEYQENLLVKYYTKHGHDVTVITSTFESVFDYYADRHDNRTPSRTYYDRGAKIIKLRYRYNLLNRLRAFTNILPILEDEAPDLLFVHDIMLNIPEVISYKNAHPHCRMILDYHADYSNSGKNWVSLKILHGMIRKWFLDAARPHLSRIFPIIPASAAFLQEVYGVPLEEMELLPLGADTDLGREVSSAGEGAKLRRSHDIPESDIVVFTGGKLGPLKRTEVLIAAFQALDRRDTHLFVVGDAADIDEGYKKQLFSLAAGNPRIHFTGWLGTRQIYAYLDMADLAVFPASQSILWQQAISMGLPLIVGNTGHQDLTYLNAYRSILILQAEQIAPGPIGEALDTLVKDASLRAAMAQGARQITEELLNWDTLMLRTLRFNVESRQRTD